MTSGVCTMYPLALLEGTSYARGINRRCYYKIMNIYISHSGNYDYENELYRPIKQSNLSATHHFFLPHEPENIDIDAVDELMQTDVLVAESSYPSTGQGIELAQAKAAGVPIICFFKAGCKPSGSLRFVTGTIIQYDDIHDLLARLRIELDQLAARNKKSQ